MKPSHIHTIFPSTMYAHFNCGYWSQAIAHNGSPINEVFIQQIKEIHRFDFFVWFFLIQGEINQMIDFEKISLQAGQATFVRPHQVHALRIENPDEFDGFFISWRDEFLLNGIDNQMFPSVQHFSGCQKEDLLRLCELLQTGLHLEDKSLKKQFLQAQFSAFLWYLQAQFGQNAAHAPSIGQRRYQAFADLVEHEFMRQHQVQFYAAQLLCSPKTLNLTCQQHAHLTAKQLIERRILLEAKRLLVHTSLSMNEISEKLGFREGTHFAKFFKKNMECTANAFRQQWAWV